MPLLKKTSKLESKKTPRSLEEIACRRVLTAEGWRRQALAKKKKNLKK